jgi:hypothetical protein
MMYAGVIVKIIILRIKNFPCEDYADNILFEATMLLNITELLILETSTSFILLLFVNKVVVIFFMNNRY